MKPTHRPNRIKVFCFFFSKKKTFLVLAILGFASPTHAETSDQVRSAHRLACATVQNADDWNSGTQHGNLSALGTEICRAVAVAILGPAGGLAITPYPAEPEALAALQSGAVQLAVGLTPSPADALHFGVTYGPPVFFDSQRILTHRHSGITTLDGLQDALICAIDLSPPERTLRDVMTARGIPYALASHSEQGEMDAAIAVRRCAAGTGLESRLAQSRANFHARTEDFVFLPDRLTLDPVVPAVRAGDPTFALIVEYTISALIEAEALGITKANVGEAQTRTDLRATQLLGRDFATAQALGLAHHWAAQVIAATGNFGEVFERTVAAPYRLDRGLNALWTQGGLMHPRPMH